MEQIPLSHILILSSALFFLGTYGFFARRNLITVLMSTELILNSVNINFVAFNKYNSKASSSRSLSLLWQPQRFRFLSRSLSTSTGNSRQ